MNILIIHQYFLATGQGGGSRFNELARLWTRAGHNVTVIAGTVNYATGEVAEGCAGKWLVHRREEGIDVWRCHVPDSYKASYGGRMWAFGGFMASAATAAMLVRRADVVVATSPPLTVAVPAWIAANLRLCRSKLVFEVRDLWPESAVTTGVIGSKSLLAKALYGVEAWAYRSADLINVLTPAFRADILDRGLAPPEKIVFVPNGADLDTFQPGPRDNSARQELGWGDKTVLLYAGAHGRANALHQLVDTAELLRCRPDIHFAFVGDGSERQVLEASARSRGLSNVQFCGPQPKTRMSLLVNAADIGAAVLQNNPTFRTVYPNKVFDYMACERPVLLGIDGIARSLVCDEAQAGLFAAPENPQAIAAAVVKLAESSDLRRSLGRSGRAWVLANASREGLADRYLDYLRDLSEPARADQRPAGGGCGEWSGARSAPTGRAGAR